MLATEIHIIRNPIVATAAEMLIPVPLPAPKTGSLVAPMFPLVVTVAARRKGNKLLHVGRHTCVNRRAGKKDLKVASGLCQVSPSFAKLQRGFDHLLLCTKPRIRTNRRR